MKKGVVITLGVLGFLAIVALISLGSLWSHRQHAVALEQKIDAQYSANKSDYDSMWKKFKEMTQVTDMQANHYKEIYTGLIEGRNKDTQLLMKMIKEDNPKLDGKVYTELQREIAASREQFNNNQKKMVDVVREYNTYVQQKIFLAMFTGREPKKMDDYIVTSEKTQKAFDSKKDDAIDLGGK